MTIEERVMICTICGKEIPPEGQPPHQWLGGHNAEPVAAGRCCGECNTTVVIPKRIAQMGGAIEAWRKAGKP
jgi:hypothetical protein